MLTLALDTSASVATVALLEDTAPIATASLFSARKHGESLLPLIESLLASIGKQPSDIDLFSASVGPGSFTGIRIGISTLKGLAFGQNKPCIGVSTLAALAANLRGLEGILVPVIDARRGNYYTALFSGKTGERLTEDALLSASDLLSRLSDCRDESIYFVGDGAKALLAMAADAGLTQVRTTPAQLIDPCAVSVGLLALQKFRNGEDILTDLTIQPIYLSPCQAERELNEKAKETAK